MTRSIDAVLADLRAPDRRAAVLDDLRLEPARDPRVAHELESMFTDEAPYRFAGPLVGEVRLAAALALAADGRTVRLRARRPMRGSALFDRLEQVGLDLPDPTSTSAMEAAFVRLRDGGWLPELELVLDATTDVADLAARVEVADLARAAPEAPVGSAERVVTEDDVAFYLDALSDRDPEQRAIAAQNLASTPTADLRVVERLRGMLDDEGVCLVGIPIRIGEVRYLAAIALRAELRARGDASPVRVTCVEPLTSEALEQRRVTAGLPRSGSGIAAQLATFDGLRRGGHLAARELTLR